MNLKTAPDASLAESEGRLAAILTAFKKIPEIKHTYATIGAGDTGTVRDVGLYVKLHEKKERRRDQAQVQEAVRQALKDIPGIRTVRLPGNSRAVWHLYAVPLRRLQV